LKFFEGDWPELSATYGAGFLWFQELQASVTTKGKVKVIVAMWPELPLQHCAKAVRILAPSEQDYLSLPTEHYVTDVRCYLN
jgi:hypothetical protein